MRATDVEFRLRMWPHRLVARAAEAAPAKIPSRGWFRGDALHTAKREMDPWSTPARHCVRILYRDDLWFFCEELLQRFNNLGEHVTGVTNWGQLVVWRDGT